MMKVARFFVGVIIGLSLMFSFPATGTSGEELAYRQKRSHKVYKHKTHRKHQKVYKHKRPRSTYRGKPNPSWKYHKQHKHHKVYKHPKPVYRTKTVYKTKTIYRRPAHHHHGCFIGAAGE